MFERFTDPARQVIVLAQEEARGLNHDHIGTEHLLLATLRAADTAAARALNSLGVSLEAARRQVEIVVGRGTGPSEAHIPFTAQGKKALELALREALQLRHSHIGPEHILLGIIQEGEGAAAQVLEDLGVQLGDAREQLMELLRNSADDPNREDISVSVGMEVSETMGAGALSGDEPRCPRCNAEAADNARLRTVGARHDSTDEAAEPVTLVWCGVCGAVLGALPGPSP